MSDVINRTATRYLTRHKTRQVSVIEAEAKAVDVRFTPTHVHLLSLITAFTT
jgi:hypothetical protein